MAIGSIKFASFYSLYGDSKEGMDKLITPVKPEIPANHKECWDCKLILHYSNYYLSKREPDRHQDQCIACTLRLGRKRLKANGYVNGRWLQVNNRHEPVQINFVR